MVSVWVLTRMPAEGVRVDARVQRLAKLGKHENKLNSEREGSRPNINLHLAVPLSLGEEEGNGGVCV